MCIIYLAFISKYNSLHILFNIPCTEDLQKKLEDWIAPNSKIKLLRHEQREGLIRARLTGAKAVTGQVHRHNNYYYTLMWFIFINYENVCIQIY